MYFNPPPQSSPAITHKLSNHHDVWSRAHHHALGGGGSNGVMQQHHAPSSYNLYNVPNMQQHHPSNGMASHPPLQNQHHHQNSLTNYSSPPNGVTHQPQHGLAQSSPSASSGQVMSQHWQQQLLKYDMIRASRSPFHRARQSALAARPTAKAAITITDPNRIKPVTEPNQKEVGNGSETGSPNGTPENHPSSTAAPVSVAPRPTATHQVEYSWNSLDMGGINLKNLPRNSGLWSFTFLQNLYLNHNALTVIPPEIQQLKYLELLDLSGNSLSTIPPELGLLTNLKELYLFDNQLTTLPYELGTLHQLRTLGIEGNPLDSNFKTIVQRDGTQALIAFLRDQCPLLPPPPARQWLHQQTEAERKAQDADPNTEKFSVLCYNILCERCATERLYGYTPSWALTWDYRKELILTEVMNHGADFLCLQEVDVAQYEDYFLQHLSEQGYEGVYWPKARANTMEDSLRKLVDGCATFYRSSKYQLVEKHLIEFRRLAMQRPDFKKTDDMFNRVLQRDDIAVVTLFENRITGTRVILAQTHIFWDPQYRDVKLVQVALLVDEIEKIAARFALYPPRPPQPGDSTDSPSKPLPHYSDGTKIPTIICGDFNSVPESGVYEYLANGSVPADHADFMQHTYGVYTSEGMRHKIGLKSAYAGIGELSVTNYVPSFQGAIDYIWYSSNNLTVTGLLGDIDKDYLSKVVGFPNAHFPSDHVCILSEFRVKPPKDTPAHPPPTFPSSNR